ncbi:hypothetical protein HAX54_049755 [Datura stramonium]|uniref:Uncharacterized protein n=1 Tax=Datura stramonium TaxID=4076 RepID=A0ABS8SW09_DATST|nr:hypothetical protein [Datura stramonium]
MSRDSCSRLESRPEKGSGVEIRVRVGTYGPSPGSCQIGVGSRIGRSQAWALCWVYGDGSEIQLLGL